MAKKVRRSKKSQASRDTNWLLIGGIAVVGVIGLFALLYLALREPETQSLAAFCDAADGNCISYGEADAPVTLVEVSDFGCGHCRDFHLTKAPEIMERFVNSGSVRWIFLPFALRPETVPAANAAMCANEQARYFEFTDALFAQQPPENSILRTGFLAAGEEVGLDIESFTQCLEEGRYNSTVNRNQQAATAARVNATPTFFINDEILRGNVPLAEFERRFLEALNS